MVGKTHIVGGLALGLVPLVAPQNIFIPQNNMIYLASVALGSLLPDIDISNSTISKILFPVHILISPFVQHRGITHTLITMGLLSVATIPIKYVSTTGFIIGYTSHLLLDCMTPTGLKLLKPFSNKEQHLLYIKTGSKAEMGLYYLLIITDLFLLKSTSIPLQIFNDLVK